MRANQLLPLAAAFLLASGAARAGDPESCQTVRFSDVGWTDITSTTAATSVVLQGLGYEPEAEVLSVPVTYASLKNKAAKAGMEGPNALLNLPERRCRLRAHSCDVGGDRLGEALQASLSLPNAI